MTGPTTQDQALATIRETRATVNILHLEDYGADLTQAADLTAARMGDPANPYQHEFSLVHRQSMDFERLLNATRAAIRLRTR